jgi:hypothetical protein
VLNNPHKLWNWEEICWNPNLTWNDVKNNPNKPWNWDTLSYHPDITWDIIQENPKYPWNFVYICRNPNISLEIIQANSDKLNDYYMISCNPSVSWEMLKVLVIKSKDKNLNFDYLSLNFDLYKIAPHVIRRYFAAKSILRYWKNAICNPEYAICKKRLLREFSELL